MLKMLVVDDHVIIRKGVLRILEENLGLPVICDEATSAEETERKVASGEYSLVFQALSLAHGDGLELLKRLHRKRPDLPILALSTHPEERDAIEALALGAAGYLTTESPPGDLVAAVQRILAGARDISTLHGENPEAQEGPPPPHQALSEREHQILRMIGSGKTPTEIARELLISVKTISTYRSRILQKIGLRSTAQLMHYAFKNNLLE